jgi:MFS family permease
VEVREQSENRYVRLWRRPGYAGFFLTVLLSRTAANMFIVAGVLLVIDRTGSVSLAGITVAAASLPAALTGPVLGAWLDIARTRRLLIAVDQVLSAVALVALLVLAGHAPNWTLPVVGVLYSVTRPFSSGSFVSTLPELAGPELVGTASSLEASSINVSVVLGPAFAGVLVGTVGAGAAIAAEAASALLVAALVAANPAFEVRSSQRAERISSALFDGLRALGKDRVLRATGLASTFAMLGWGLMAIGYPLYARRTLHVGANAGGYLWAALAVGSIVGTFALRGEATLRRIAISYTLLCLSALAWLAARDLTTAIAVVALSGVLEGPAFVGTVLIRQRYPPPAVRAQVNTTIASVGLAASALGSLIGGVLHHPVPIIVAFMVVNLLAAATIAASA